MLKNNKQIDWHNKTSRDPNTLSLYQQTRKKGKSFFIYYFSLIYFGLAKLCIYRETNTLLCYWFDLVNICPQKLYVVYRFLYISDWLKSIVHVSWITQLMWKRKISIRLLSFTSVYLKFWSNLFWIYKILIGVKLERFLCLKKKSDLEFLYIGQGY